MSSQTRARASLQDISRMTGIPASSVSALRRGTMKGSDRHRALIVAACSADPDGLLVWHRLATVPWLSATVRAGLRHGEGPTWLVAQARETLAHARLLEDQRDVAAALAEPLSTGSPQWDSLIAGVADIAAAHHGVSLGWSVRPCYFTRPWFAPVGWGRDAESTLLATPPEIRGRGVVLPSSALQAL